eukprot:11178237-Ditylum_brightwellii.AAC.1
MEKENVKTSPNCITRDVMVWENVTKEKERKSVETIIVCVTITWMSATLCKPTGSTFSPCTVSQNSRGSGRSGLSRMPKGRPKRCGLTGKEVKDLNAFFKDKIKETIKECNCNMHAMSDFEDLSISSSSKHIQSIISNTSVEGSDNKSCKLVHKK